MKMATIAALAVLLAAAGDFAPARAGEAPATEEEVKQLREQVGFPKAGVWDPASISGTHVIYVLHDATHPEQYGGLPANPRIPISYTIWKYFLKPISLFSVFLGAVGVVFHYVGYGPKRTQPEPPIKKEEKNGNR